MPSASGDSSFASRKDAVAFAAALPDNYLQCRTWGHQWRHHTAHVDPESRRYYVIIMACQRCPTKRHQDVSFQGALLGNTRYDYPDGYKPDMPIGRIVGAGKDALRMEMLHRLIPKELRRHSEGGAS